MHWNRYAILDECSSAISAEMERRLYRICMEQNISYISIAQYVSCPTMPLKSTHIRP